MDIRGIIRRQDLEIIENGSTVAKAIEKMVDRNVGSLIVRRPSPHDPYGIITKQDILFKVVAKGLDPSKVPVTDVMSSPVVILNNVDLDVKYAAQAMANAKVTNLVIFDGGDVFGFLSSSDIIDALRKQLTIDAITKKADIVSGGC